MAYSAIKVANEFLRLARMSAPPQPITPLKLIKLVYIANGWSLALLNEPLVSESAEAWAYGPVMPSLYRAIRSYRSFPVTDLIVNDSDPQEVDGEDAELINAVFLAYGKLSGIQLSNMTHLPGTPWSDTWSHGAGRNVIIPPELIAQHYQELAQRRATEG